MTETPPRRPAAFRLDSPTGNKKPEETTAPEKKPARKPTAIRDMAVVTPAPVDVFEAEGVDPTELDALTPPPALPSRRRFPFGGVLTGALGILVSLAVGIWTDDLIRALFDRSTWLGWLGLSVAAIALLAFLVIIAREALALRRLASVQSLREEAADAATRDDARLARDAVSRLTGIAAGLPATARGREMLGTLSGDIIDGRDLIRLAETEILRPLDREARGLILAAAKRVSIVTAVSPRALVDIGYVIFESARLIRRLSELYGSRPGTLGFFTLTRRVIAHLAVTGTLAVGDSFVQQIIGHGLASRLSAKLGEGVINGLMTARIGISAMDIVRPFPFIGEKRPGISDFLGDLAKLTGGEKDKKKD
jgi:putative membrane protein